CGFKSRLGHSLKAVSEEAAFLLGRSKHPELWQHYHFSEKKSIFIPSKLPFMKKALNVILFSALLAAGCTKTETKTDPCAKGTIKFVSMSDHSYSIYLNDEQVKNVVKRETYEHSGFTGHYNIKVQQDSGYVAAPYVKEYSINLKGCATETINIPRQPGEPPLE
ncbi:MAG: hypothetical protein K8F30_10775, partial [Taibaiella sp.]|nr:hypothetical protein [Taibaiella sp.]